MRVVLLYRVQGDVADAARVAALQACQENPESLIVPSLSIVRVFSAGWGQAQRCTGRKKIFVPGLPTIQNRNGSWKVQLSESG